MCCCDVEEFSLSELTFEEAYLPDSEQHICSRKHPQQPLIYLTKF